MACHRHLINLLQGSMRAAAPQMGQNVLRLRSLCRRSLDWELREKGELHACWTWD